MADEIYIPLLDEGVDVYRPAPAHQIGPSIYIILRPDDYDPEDENWAFPPGTTVIGEPRQLAGGTVLTAVRRIQPGRQTA
jgi:hypothetical protein